MHIGSGGHLHSNSRRQGRRSAHSAAGYCPSAPTGDDAVGVV
jgi:hypothetical protein